MKKEREGMIVKNNQGCSMKCIQYINALNITIKFLDEYGCTKKTCWANFIKGKVHNPYVATVYGIGIIGDKYSIKAKEFQAWCDLLFRTTESFKSTNPTYENVTVCEEWLYYPNFYEWLHSQENFDKWFNGKRWCVDKDILFKNNKIYSPDTCCLVPNKINTLFVKKNANRGLYPIGVTKNHDNYMALCSNPYEGTNHVYLGTYNTPEKAFNKYKIYKENLIKKIAEEEYLNGVITEKCYEAMKRYIVEIDD